MSKVITVREAFQYPAKWMLIEVGLDKRLYQVLYIRRIDNDIYEVTVAGIIGQLAVERNGNSAVLVVSESDYNAASPTNS